MTGVEVERRNGEHIYLYCLMYKCFNKLQSGSTYTKKHYRQHFSSYQKCIIHFAFLA